MAKWCISLSSPTNSQLGTTLALHAGPPATVKALASRFFQCRRQVLFCRLTPYQRRLYGEFLESTEVKSVLSRTMRAFRAIGILRKLCNHPDLVCRFGDSVVTRCVTLYKATFSRGTSGNVLFVRANWLNVNRITRLM